MFAAAYVAPDGRLRHAGRAAALAFHGRQLLEPAEADLIPLPDGAVLSMLPDRVAIGGEGDLPGAPAAALLPIGYTRTLLPAYRLNGKPLSTAAPARGEVLPLFGYTAVAMRAGQPYVAAMPTDDPRPWQHHDPGYTQLRRLIKERYATHGTASPLLSHIAHCALKYECRSAQHIFYGRGEGALPSSPTCNAACVGCISDQPDPDIQPHQRLDFVPDLDEATDIAVAHLENSPEAMISLGQGCEGEPLLNSRNVELLRRIRRRTSAGVINVNTNGSRPAILQRLIDAGLGSIRVSMFSAREDVFERYYKPAGYSLKQVEGCLGLASRAGLLTSINLLTFPGVTDDAAEVEALTALLIRGGVDLVQLRNLNIDPEQLWPALHGLEFRPIGIRAMAQALRAAGLAIGSYTHATRAGRAASRV